jgi:HK97 family phage portal protein
LAKSKQGQSLVLENGIEYQPLSLSAVDADYVEQAKFSVEQACRLFALDSIFVSHSGTNSQSYASQREASKSLYSNTLRPYIEAVTAELHIKLLTSSQRLAGEKIEVNQNELQSLSVKDRIEVYEKLLSAQVITPEQVAKIEGFDYADS